MSNPQIFLSKAFLPEYDEYINEIKDLWDSHWITSMGRKHGCFEQKLQEYLRVKNVSVFTNGHNALELLIAAMNLRGEIITTPYTFVSTTHAIVRNGLTPVFCDIKEEDFTIDVDKIEELITERTTGILAVHVYGNPCDIKKIDAIAQKYHLKVIYDAAHAFGEKYEGKSIGEYGDASVFSFHASKVFNSIEGGCAVYKDSSLQSILYKLRNFGICNQDVEYIGTNAKMNEFVAAMGICNLRHIDEIIEKRRILTNRYIMNLKDIDGIVVKTSIEEKSYTRNFSYFPIIIDECKLGLKRDQLCNLLNDEGIQALRQFYPLTSELSCYKYLNQDNVTPVAKRVSEQILLLPLYADLSLQEVDYICERIKYFVSRR